MAKARLAITNNANKISHLEQLMSFIWKKAMILIDFHKQL